MGLAPNVREHQISPRHLRDARAAKAAGHGRDAAAVGGLEINVAVFDGVARPGFTGGVIIGGVAVNIHRAVKLVVAAAVQSAVGPHQRVIAKRIHRRDAAPVVAAVAARFGADIAALERICLTISAEADAQAIGGAGQEGFVRGVISRRHIAARDQQR